MEWTLKPIKIKDTLMCKGSKTVEFYNYCIEFSELKINSINGKGELLRAIIYKDGYVVEIKIAFSEEDLHLQVDNYFKQ